MATVEAEPNISQSNSLPPDDRPVRPVNSPNSCGACSQTATYGSTSSTSQTGCVQQLDPTDQRHTVDHQRNHHHCAQQIAPAQRQAEIHFDRQRHDGRFDGKEYECEARIDKRSDGRAEIAGTRVSRSMSRPYLAAQ